MKYNDVEFNKKKFYETMQEYFDQQLVREVFSTDKVSVLCVGELFYVASAYSFYKGEPLATYVGKGSIERLSQKDDAIYEFQKTIFSDFERFNHMIHLFGPNRLDFYKQFIREKIQTEGSMVDYEFEEQLLKDVKRKGL